MAQSGFTPIQIYYSTTPAAVPVSANLANGELAINIADGKLYYKDNLNLVKLLASFSPVAAGSNTQVQYNSSGNLAGSANFTFDGTSINVNSVLFGRGGSAANFTNIGIGFNTLLNVFSGSDNVGVGYLSSGQIDNTSNNTSVGSNSAYRMKGSDNVAIGYAALRGSVVPANNTGSSNVAIGSNSLPVVSSGASNTAVGYAAGLTLTTGNFNTAIGQQSLVSNQTSGANTAIGWGSLYGATGGFNTAIGANAGLDMTSGSKNVIIGSFSGNNGGLDIRALSNYIVLSDGDGNPRAYWNGADATFNGPLFVASVLRTGWQTITSAATITPNSDVGNQFNVNGLAVPANIAAPSGTPVDGQKLIIRLRDNNTARALTWNAIYRAIGVTLPTTTVATKTTYVGCIYNAYSLTWDVVAVTTQA